MISVVVTYLVKVQYAEKFLARITKHAETSFNNEDGCLYFDVGRCSENPNKFSVYEVFESISHFNQHKEKAYFYDYANEVDDWLIEKNVAMWQRHYSATSRGLI